MYAWRAYPWALEEKMEDNQISLHARGICCIVGKDDNDNTSNDYYIYYNNDIDNINNNNFNYNNNDDDDKSSFLCECVLSITYWRRDRQPLPSRDSLDMLIYMGKAVTFHTPHTAHPLSQKRKKVIIYQSKLGGTKTSAC